MTLFLSHSGVNKSVLRDWLIGMLWKTGTIQSGMGNSHYRHTNTTLTMQLFETIQRTGPIHHLLG